MLIKDRAKITKAGLFSRKHDTYGIKTSLKEALIYRKQTDFNDLRNALVKLCPGYVIPALPKKPIKRLEDKYMNNRKVELQLFLRKLLEHPLLKKIGLVWSFLTIESDSEYENLRKEMEKINNAKDVADFITPEGEANIAIDDSSIQFCNEVNNSTGKVKDEFEK